MEKREIPFYFNLQLFARPEDEGRTIEPTPRRIRLARIRGQVAKTFELTPAMVTLFATLLLSILGLFFFFQFFNMVKFTLSNLDTLPLSFDSLGVVIVRIGLPFLTVALPMLLCCLIIALFFEFFQVGFVFAWRAFRFDLARLRPTAERLLRHLFLSLPAVVEYSKTIFKFSVIFFFTYQIIKSEYPRLINTIDMGPMQAFFYIAKLAYRIMIRVAIFLVFMSLLDYLFQRRRYRESLMMTPRELREEYKLYEGDPLVKARLRRRYRELLQRRLARSVESADVVITNPVKLAVAIRYEASSMPAPIVVAKGKGELARHIKELAEKFNIPIVENPPLCQALYNSTEVGDQIPRELYDAVAEVLAFVYQKKAATAS